MSKPEVDILSVDETNLEESGFFCYKSKRDSPGYANKLAWMRHRLAEGLRLKILLEDGVSRGFIEYIPGEYAWRAVKAPSHLFIHCLWVVGKAKGKGYGALLLQQCFHDAKRDRLHGVTVLASSSTWLTNPSFFLRSGFQTADPSQPPFSLLARSFGRQPLPTLPTDWNDRCKALGSSLTVVLTDQCPYIDRMKQAVFNVGRRLGIRTREVKLDSAQEVQTAAPSPYGVYGIVYRGNLVSYHPIGTEPLLELMQEVM